MRSHHATEKHMPPKGIDLKMSTRIARDSSNTSGIRDSRETAGAEAGSAADCSASA
jgi:hypothetical protein